MKKNDILWVDFIRVIATFLVILLHSAVPLLTKYNELSITNWWAGNIYYSLSRMCAPLFFILSGYLLLAKDEPIQSFFAKRIGKVLVPLIIWSIFYILWKRYYVDCNPLSFFSFYSILFKPVYYHLWFLYVIVGLYLYTPILRVLVRNSTKELLYYFLALWVFAVFFIPFLEKAFHIESKIDLKMISGYVGYLVLGHLLGKIKVTQKFFFISVFTTIAIIIITAVITYLLTSWKAGGYFGYFYSYLGANIILVSATTFLLLRYFSEELGFLAHGALKKFLSTLNSATLGIYLIHPMILFVLKKGDLGFSLSGFSFNAILSIPVTAVITFFISFVIVSFLQKIPVIRKCVP